MKVFFVLLLFIIKGCNYWLIFFYFFVNKKSLLRYRLNGIFCVFIILIVINFIYRGEMFCNKVIYLWKKIYFYIDFVSEYKFLFNVSKGIGLKI